MGREGFNGSFACISNENEDGLLTEMGESNFPGNRCTSYGEEVLIFAVKGRFMHRSGDTDMLKEKHRSCPS